MADMTPIFLLKEAEEPMVTHPIYLSSDESEYSTPNTTPDHHHESIYPDSVTQLIAFQLEQQTNMGTETVFYRPTPNTSMISDDDEILNLTPIFGNPEPRRFRNDATTQYNFANMCNQFQTRPNHHLRQIKVRETFCVPTIYPTHRHQLHLTIPSISRQWLMDCKS